MACVLSLHLLVQMLQRLLREGHGGFQRGSSRLLGANDLLVILLSNLSRASSVIIKVIMITAVVAIIM